MSVLADAATALLPPGLIAGFLGIDVGRMSGVDGPAAFWTVVLLVLGLGVLEYIVLLKL
jgi:Mg2+ and Co2+ transporter CorA